MESTIDKNVVNSDKTNIYYRSWDSIKKGLKGKPYVVMRYKEIVDDKVPGFNDKNEYNNGKIYSTLIKPDKDYKGYIDYIDDTDYYKVTLDTDSKYTIRIKDFPKSCICYVIDGSNKIITSIKKKGTYTVNFSKGVYYIKFSGVGLKFENNSNYTFDLIKFQKRSSSKSKSKSKGKTKPSSKKVKKII